MTSVPQLAPSFNELVPWTDRRGRFHPLRATVLVLLVAPGLWLALRWALGLLAPEPINAAIHATGYDAIWILLASLVVTPAKALLGTPNIVVVRRMMGNAALFYALLHLGLYATDQHWVIPTIVSEIVKRFYLTIGFVSLLGLLLLGITSTDGWARHLGRTWKRLHRIVYGLTALGLFHYVLQSKLDVSQALLAAGVFAWLMLWRFLPAGQDRTWYGLLGVTAGAMLVTVACEYLWYRLGTRINPEKVLAGELDVTYGLHPVAQTGLLGLVATLLLELRRLGEAAAGLRPGAAMAVTVAFYAICGVLGEAAPWFFGWLPGTIAMDEPWPWGHAVLWVALLGGLGAVRWRLAETWQKHLVDAVLAGCVVYEAARLTTDDPHVVAYGGAGLVIGSVLLALRLRSASRAVLLALVPLVLLLAYQAALA